MGLKQNSDAVRAITGVFVGRLLKTGSWLLLAIFTALLVLLVILANMHSAWWLIGLAPWASAVIIVILFLMLLRFALAQLMPRPLTSNEVKTIESYLDQASRISDRLQTPWPWLLVLIGYDVIRGNDSRVVREVIADSKTLQPEYEKIRSFFV